VTEIKTVRTRGDRLQFIKMPWKIYKQDPHWVPPLISDQKTFLNPRKGVFFDHGEAELFLALRDGRAVGRLSAHVNHLQDQLYTDGKGFFGFFECADDQEAADALFAAAEGYLRDKGKTSIEGPMSFGVYDEIGILVDGFESDPYVLNMHNPPYYQDLVTAAGYDKAIDWYAYRGYTRDRVQVDPRLYRLRDRVLNRADLKIRNVDLKQFRSEAGIIKQIYDQAWKENWGHVPLTEREYQRIVHELVRFVIPEISFVAEVDGKPVGFALSIYDANVAVKKLNGRLFPFGFIKLLANVKKTDRFRHILMGILKEYRNQGIEIAFYAGMADHAEAAGLREVEMSLIVENNDAMRGSLKHLPVEIYKTYRIYTKEL
jgi:GNAT superfamily N-acetyltransferase